MSKKSTGLASHLAVTGSLKSALDGGFLFWFSGPEPASADDAIDGSSVKLLTVTKDGDGVTGLTFEAAAADGILTKTAAEAWSGVFAASGAATFYRYCEAGDAGTAASTTAKRVQGPIGTTVASEGVVPSTDVVSGNTQSIDLFQIQ